MKYYYIKDKKTKEYLTFDAGWPYFSKPIYRKFEEKNAKAIIKNPEVWGMYDIELELEKIENE